METQCLNMSLWGISESPTFTVLLGPELRLKISVYMGWDMAIYLHAAWVHSVWITEA